MSRFMTMLAVDAPAHFTEEQIIESFRTLDPDGVMPVEGAGGSGAEGADEGEGNVMVVNGMPFAILNVDAPLPKDAWEAAASLAFNWREAGEYIGCTKAHIIVAALKEPEDHPEKVAAAVGVTMLAAALARLLPSSAVIFEESMMVFPGSDIEQFGKGLMKRELPTLMWAGLSFIQGQAGADGKPLVGAHSRGMQAFCGREVVIVPGPFKAAEAAQRLMGVCEYLIAQGPVIKDGDTIGVSDDEHMRVTFLEKEGVPIMEVTYENSPTVH